MTTCLERTLVVACGVLLFGAHVDASGNVPGGAATNTTVARRTAGAARDTVYPLPPVIVTATHAKARATPATFSNLTTKDIKERYSMQDIPGLLSELPSITTYSENGNGIGYNYISLRGFDQRRISVMINGVPQNDPEDHNVYWLDFPDLLASTDNVQVQRGAGSAFYGPPAIGGSVNLVTNPFRREPALTLEALFGFQESGAGARDRGPSSRRYNAAFNSGSVAERYMVYGKLGRILSDGYRDNSFARLDSYFLGAVRSDPKMSTRFHFFGGPIEDGLAYFGLPKFVNHDRALRRQNLSAWEIDSTGREYLYAIPRRSQEVERFSQPHYEVIHAWRPSPKVTVHNTVFHYTGEGFFDYDASWADTTTLRLGSEFGLPATANPGNTLVRAFVGNRQWGWLPRAELAHPSGDLTLGAEVRVHRSTHWGRIQFATDLPPDLPPDYHFYEYDGAKDIVSLYAHEVLRPSERLTLMGDLQIVRNRYAISHEKFLGNHFSVSYLFANPRLGVNFNLSERLNGYLALARTSREPRLRNLYAAEDSYFGATPQFAADTSTGRVRYDFDRPLAKPEHLVDIEAGVRHAGARLGAGANVFWMEFTDELIKSGQVDIFGQPVTGNAPRSRHVGLELDLALDLGGVWALGANAALSRNRLVRYSVVEGSSRVDLGGNSIAGFPDLLANLRVTYRRPRFVASVLAKYVGPFYTDNFESAAHRNDAYHVTDLSVLYTTPRVANADVILRGEIRNIFNRLYFASGEGAAFFPAAERNYLIGLTLNL